ncbi:MAG: bifunctional metallophosphatase/5'-nucleotidase [Bacteroidaceae bacterium]
MKKVVQVITLVFALCTFTNAQTKQVVVKFIETTDIHGSFFPTNFNTGKHVNGSLACIQSFVQEQRKTYGKNLLLLDNGDILQGQPTVYWSNYIDTLRPNLAARIMNYMQYDVATIGNHDIETGHKVYDKWAQECNFPILLANGVQTSTQKAYFPPYKIFEREGVRIVVLGMLTPAIPAWLPEDLWSDIHFEDMVKSAKKWVTYLQEVEQPDFIVGLFHSGLSNGIQTKQYTENASKAVAEKVPGFDVVFFGHDHQLFCQETTSKQNKKVWLVNPANNGLYVGEVTATFTLKDKKVTAKKVTAQLVSMKSYSAEKRYMKTFAPDLDRITAFITEPIGFFATALSTDNCLFGPCSLVKFIHQVQLALSGAEISLTAPLSTRGSIKAGAVYMHDMFQLYHFENKLFVMSLTGKEIKEELEESYGRWFNQMKKPTDHLLLLKDNKPLNYIFNFDSAAGIKYCVNVKNPKGSRVRIISMEDGTPFSFQKRYRVAVNSYRANGGGELLTRGSKIEKKELKKRIQWRSLFDLRYYIIKYIKAQKTVQLTQGNNWWVEPKGWAIPAQKRDSQLLNRGYNRE